MPHHDYLDRRKALAAHRRGQVRHLVRSVGVELADGQQVPYFIEPSPGKFRANPGVRNVEITDANLRTLRIPSETPAKIPPDGLPPAALRRLIEIGLRGGDDL